MNYYNLEIPKKNEDIKKNAEDILAEKLCGCIKKVSPDNEPKAIGICTKTLFNNKGLTRGNFTCQKEKFVYFKKTSKTSKTKKTKKTKNNKKNLTIKNVKK